MSVGVCVCWCVCAGVCAGVLVCVCARVCICVCCIGSLCVNTSWPYAPWCAARRCRLLLITFPLRLRLCVARSVRRCSVSLARADVAVFLAACVALRLPCLIFCVQGRVEDGSESVLSDHAYTLLRIDGAALLQLPLAKRAFLCGLVVFLCLQSLQVRVVRTSGSETRSDVTLGQAC